MDLYVIRHAQAGHFGDPRWPDDRERPLTEDGRERFARVAERLVERGVMPGVIATSPAIRCLQTAQILADAMATNPEIVELDDLLPGGDLDAMLAWTIRQLEKSRQITWVGHSPDVGHMLARLFGSSQGCIRLAKGACASVRFLGMPEIGHGELRWLITAKMMGF